MLRYKLKLTTRYYFRKKKKHTSKISLFGDWGVKCMQILALLHKDRETLLKRILLHKNRETLSKSISAQVHHSQKKNKNGETIINNKSCIKSAIKR